jgi:sporulation protein YlmC with PRC-barrel domain
MSKTILGAAVAAGLLLSAPAFAQTSAPAAAAPAAKVSIPGGVFYKGLGPQQYAAKDRLIGANVVNKDGVVVGDIKDLILNNANEIEGVILGTGGILGAGEKEVGVRYTALEFSKKDGKQVIRLPQATKEVVAALEPYARTRKSLAERAQDKLKALADKTKEGAGPALEKAKELGSKAVEKGKELGSKAMEKTKEAVETAKEKAAPQKQ